MALMMWSSIVTGGNLLLIASLLFVYARTYARTRSMFTVGLLLFASLFFLQNLVSFYYLLTMMPYFVPEVEPYVLTFNILQFLAFGVLNWITWR